MIEMARVEDIPEGGSLRVQVEGRYIALFKVKSEIFAISAICPHAGAFLNDGYMDGHVVYCPLHGWDFDVRTGESPSFGCKTRKYEVVVKDGAVYLPEPPDPVGE